MKIVVGDSNLGPHRHRFEAALPATALLSKCRLPPMICSTLLKSCASRADRRSSGSSAALSCARAATGG